MNNGRLETLGLDRQDGRVLWRKPALAYQPGPVKNPGNSGPATPTPVTDGNSVYVFFGSIGLIAYDLDGLEQWRQMLAKPDLETSASPILIDDKLIIVSDRETGSFAEARDKKTGRTLWRTERPQFLRSRATPFHWIHGKDSELIVAGSYSVTSYNPITGGENWLYTGAARFATSSPAAAGELLFSASASVGLGEGDDPGDRRPLVSASTGFGESAKAKPPKVGGAVVAIRSGGSGELTEPQIAWKSSRSLPYGSSPLFYHGRLFTVKDGGLVSAYEVKTGHAIYQDARIGALGGYWASAVAAADRIYFVSEDGVVTVISATADSSVILAQNKIGEQTLATPALIDQTILFRTATNLYSFGSATGATP